MSCGSVARVQLLFANQGASNLPDLYVKPKNEAADIVGGIFEGYFVDGLFLLTEGLARKMKESSASH